MPNPCVRALVLAGALTLLAPVVTAPRNAEAATEAQLRAQRTIAQIDRFRQSTWRLQELTGRERTPTFFAERRTPDQAYRVWIRELWQKRADRALRQAKAVPNRGAWQCIHRYERDPAQGWRTHTGNGYYGGLQMDLDFQRSYGPELLRRKGTANNWTWFEQMWVAERARRSGRGFTPWPNTARYCGLI